MVAAQLFNAEKKVLPPPIKRPVHRGFSRKVVAVVARLQNSRRGKTEIIKKRYTGNLQNLMPMKVKINNGDYQH